ncbi:MAG: MFS transporter [Chitinophagaceae bacterium]|nr:MFS transporter [Chitinophagaceae bacterium]
MKNLTAFIAACAGMLLFGITLITLGSVATDLQEKFQLTGTDSGTLFSILPFGILGGSLVFGPIIDRYSYKYLLIFSCVAMFAGFEGLAYSTSHGMLKVFVFLFGLGGGIINGATNALVSDISETHKGANLSLLGVFFGIGALGMPLLLRVFSETMSAFDIIAWLGWLTIAVAVFYLLVPFPPAKQKTGGGAIQWKGLMSLLLLLIAFFLFFQSSFEAIINNWTTTYLTSGRGIMDRSDALLGLSLHIVGMVVMRLLSGSVFRKVSEIKLLWACLVMLFMGVALMQAGTTHLVIFTGLILSGAGLAEGFPLMLGITGKYFAHLSGTAFSFVFVIALTGNMLINYLMGIIADTYGINHLTTVAYIEIVSMALIFFIIIKTIKNR